MKTYLKSINLFTFDHRHREIFSNCLTNSLRILERANAGWTSKISMRGLCWQFNHRPGTVPEKNWAEIREESRTLLGRSNCLPLNEIPRVSRGKGSQAYETWPGLTRLWGGANNCMKTATRITFIGMLKTSTYNRNFIHYIVNDSQKQLIVMFRVIRMKFY